MPTLFELLAGTGIMPEWDRQFFGANFDRLQRMQGAMGLGQGEDFVGDPGADQFGGGDDDLLEAASGRVGGGGFEDDPLSAIRGPSPLGGAGAGGDDALLSQLIAELVARRGGAATAPRTIGPVDFGGRLGDPRALALREHLQTQTGRDPNAPIMVRVGGVRFVLDRNGEAVPLQNVVAGRSVPELLAGEQVGFGRGAVEDPAGAITREARRDPATRAGLESAQGGVAVGVTPDVTEEQLAEAQRQLDAIRSREAGLVSPDLESQLRGVAQAGAGRSDLASILAQLTTRQRGQETQQRETQFGRDTDDLMKLLQFREGKRQQRELSGLAREDRASREAAAAAAKAEREDVEAKQRAHQLIAGFQVGDERRAQAAAREMAQILEFDPNRQMPETRRRLAALEARYRELQRKAFAVLPPEAQGLALESGIDPTEEAAPAAPEDVADRERARLAEERVARGIAVRDEAPVPLSGRDVVAYRDAARLVGLPATPEFEREALRTITVGGRGTEAPTHITTQEVRKRISALARAVAAGRFRFKILDETPENAFLANLHGVLRPYLERVETSEERSRLERALARGLMFRLMQQIGADAG